MFNLSNLDFLKEENTIKTPREIFMSLNRTQKYEYPRDIQSQVWEKWFERKDEKDLVLKLNTGSGKTVVGLLILKSCLEEKKGPAVFITPDIFLTNQVVKEAKDLGIDITTDENSYDFIIGKSILVTNIYKIVNGLSKFGVGRKKIEIGSFIIDDAHASIATVESQFTLSIERSNIEIYSEIFNLFANSLKFQNDAFFIDMNTNEAGDKSIEVPFWEWQKNSSIVLEILNKYKNLEDNDIKFHYSLISENIKYCNCYVSNKRIEIIPHKIPLNIIPSLSNAKRKIYMTATLSDNSILISHFNVDTNSISKPIIPETAGNIGERLILTPQEINPNLSREELQKYIYEKSKEINVVVIVPSNKQALLWGKYTNNIVSADNIENVVEKLRTQHLGLVILVNKYDGVDLPNDACRLLVIDELPNAKNLKEKHKEEILSNSPISYIEKIQKLEQGMGRGIRSSIDYCVVLILGTEIARLMHNEETLDYFSPATKRQLQLSKSVINQMKDANIERINEAIDYCLNRNSNWTETSKKVLSSLTYNQTDEVNEIEINLRKAYDNLLIGQYPEAISEVQKCFNKPNLDNSFSAYLQQILAEYTNLVDEIESQEILKSAIKKNSNVIKPIKGITYNKLINTNPQAKNIVDFIKNEKFDKNGLIIEFNSVKSNLIYSLENTSNKYEESIRKLAFFLGFYSQRPEKEYGRGPDNLWSTNSNYFVIECKNEAFTDTICKHYINQINGSYEWFKEKYQGINNINVTPLIIHKSNICEHSATPNADIKVLTFKDMQKLTDKIEKFLLTISDNLRDESYISKLLIAMNLTYDGIVKDYVEKIKIKNL